MRKAILTLLMIVGSLCIRAQGIGPSTLNASGGSGSIGSHEFDWSVGEISLVSTFTSGSVIVTQGVLQPFDAWPVEIEHTALLKQLKVFPNPAESVVNIAYTAQTEGVIAYLLMDMTGKEFQSGTILFKSGGANKQLNITSLPCASYMLEITVANEQGIKESTSYKIQKIK